MPAGKHLWTAIVFLVISLPAMLFLGSDAFRSSRDAAKEFSAAPPLVSEKHVVSPEALTVGGELRPFRTIQLSSRFGGTVSEVRVRTGDDVPAGMVVAVVRSRDLEDRLARREAAVQQAETELKSRERETAEAEDFYAQRRELVRRDLISRREAQDAAAAAETAQSALALARAYLAQQLAMLEQERAFGVFTSVIAPVDGEVLSRQARPGESIADGGAILVIGDTSRMKLNAQVPRRAAARLRVGAAAQLAISGDPSRRFTGEVSRLAEANGDNVTIEIVFDNLDRLLRSGTKGMVRIEESGSAELSTQTILRDDSEEFWQGGPSASGS